MMKSGLKLAVLASLLLTAAGGVNGFASDGIWVAGEKKEGAAVQTGQQFSLQNGVYEGTKNTPVVRVSGKNYTLFSNEGNTTFQGGKLLAENSGEIMLSKGNTVASNAGEFTTDGGMGIFAQESTIYADIWAKNGDSTDTYKVSSAIFVDCTIDNSTIGAESGACVSITGGTVKTDKVYAKGQGANAYGPTSVYLGDYTNGDSYGGIINTVESIEIGSIEAKDAGTVFIGKAKTVTVLGDISATGDNASVVVYQNAPTTVKGNVTLDNGQLGVTTSPNYDSDDAKASLTIEGTVKVSGYGEVSAFGKGAVLYFNGSVERSSGMSSAPLSAAHGAKIVFGDSSSTYTTANNSNVVNTVATADASSSIEVAAGAGLYVENAKADGKTVYDFSKATTKDGAGTGWAGAIYGDSQRVVMDKTTGIYKQQTTEETYPDSTTPSTTEEAIKTGATAAEFIAAVEAANQSGNIAADNAGVTKALNSAAGLTGLSGVGYSMTGFTQDFLSLIHQHKVSADSLWASYLHDKRTADGLKVGNLAANYKVSYDGIVIGSDFYKTDKVQVGAAFAYADGSVSTRSGIYTKNDADYYGGSIYGVMEGAAGMKYRAEIGFGRSSNEMKQYNTGTLITGKTDADAFHIGVTAEKEIETATGIWTPFIGLGFTNVSVDDYTDSLGFRHGSDSAGVWNMPIGISYHFKNDSEGWSISPVATVGYRFAFGDKDLGETVAYGNGIDHFSTDIVENVFFARLGVEAAKEAVSFGIHYGYEKGSDTKSNAWGVNIAYRF